MCGIVGATRNRQVSGVLIEGLLRLEYRGYDSAGITTQTPKHGKFRRIRVSGKVRDLVVALSEQPLRGTAGLAHTRWATHGAPSERNAHPHVVNGRTALVHNGIIENFSTLRTELLESGCNLASDTDSEVVAHLIDQHIEAGLSFLDAAHAATERLEGAFALGIMCKSDPGTIIAVRSGCPLVVGVGDGGNFIASDVLALRSVTNRFVFLEEGDTAVLNADSLQVFDKNRNLVEREPVTVSDAGEKVDKGSYRHYLEKEIHDQPQAIRSTLEGRVSGEHVIEEGLGRCLGEVLDRVQSLSIVGCGTSYYAACVARYWIEDMAQIPCSAEIASEFRYRNAAVREGSVFLSLSQSGESADTIAALRLAEQREYEHTINIGNVPTSTLMRESNTSIAMRAGVEVSVASTKSFTTMLTDILLLATAIARRHGMSQDQEQEIVRGLHQLDDVVEQTLLLDEQTRLLAEEFLPAHHALFLGRGMHYPVALEGALKLKEISYMHAEGYPAGELKHGPLALVDADMPVVAVAPNNDLLRKVQSNLQEVRARGGRLYVFTDEVSDFSQHSDVVVIEVPKVHPLLSPIVFTVPLQLLAYHVAILKGTDIDQPRNIAKSVTVE